MVVKAGFRKHPINSNSQTEDELSESPPKKRVRWRSTADVEDDSESEKECSPAALDDEEETPSFDRVCFKLFSSRFSLMGFW